jgi:hypothetical protein
MKRQVQLQLGYLLSPLLAVFGLCHHLRSGVGKFTVTSSSATATANAAVVVLLFETKRCGKH